jgi:chemotaxis methyl-accepting protein methylase
VSRIDGSAAAAPAPHELAAFDSILSLLRERTGTDFGCYRPSTVSRRVLNRMISVGARTFSDYFTLLRENHAETASLLQRVTIKVSHFYRNPAVFDVLRHRILPQLAQQRTSGPLRLWSAGCGNGEEPYTLAMLLEEAGVHGAVQATDIDPLALQNAQAGRYMESALHTLPQNLRQRYLQPVDRGGYAVCDEVRARVRFAHHDLTAGSAPPEVEFDLVCCRNVLIYLAPSVQSRVLASLAGTVHAGGYMCLGEAEWPAPALARRLEALDRKVRIFRVQA